MDIIKELNRIKIDKHKCLGCGYEHNCSLKGCAIINQAITALKKAEIACEIIEILSQLAENNTILMKEYNKLVKENESL